MTSYYSCCFSSHSARFSKRSFAAVGTFMSTAIFVASMCSPKCKVAKFLRTTAEGTNDYYPTESSTFIAALLSAIFVGITIPLLLLSNKYSSTTFERKVTISIYTNTKGLAAAISAMAFSAGLFVSGMTKNYKLYSFLDLKLLQRGAWDPTMMCVMGSGLLVSMFGYHFVPGHNLFKVCILSSLFFSHK